MSNLQTLGVANMRTLEMKVSDAGPNHMRVNPHVLTQVRKAQLQLGRLKRVDGVWYHRSTESPARVDAKLAQLRPLYAKLNNHSLNLRLGDALEIAVLRALQRSPMHFVGGFHDLTEHDDSKPYRKEEPPLTLSGRRMPGEMRFDFVAFHPVAGALGIEAKNIREWIYPDRQEVKDLLLKATTVDALPVLIARRIHYVTFKLLGECGVLLFENFNQLYPASEAELAKAVAQKDLLGYHDVRAGNAPNPHLVRFLTETVPAEAPAARERFNRYFDLLEKFGAGEMSYKSFAARVRRRRNGKPEHADVVEEEEIDPDDFEL